jgi:hypothetical protein
MEKIMRSSFLSTLVGGLLVPGLALASSHREAPLISQDPTVDSTDVYMFISPDRPDTVTVVANYIPLEEPGGGPNFHKFSDSALYEIHFDNNGDARPDITYQFRFHSEYRRDNTFLYNDGPITSIGGNWETDVPGLNVMQSYSVVRIQGARNTLELVGSAPTAPINVGTASVPDYAALRQEAIVEEEGGRRFFVGPRDDPFFVDLGAVFDLLQIRPGSAVDYVAGYNCHSIVMQLPISDIANRNFNVNNPDPNAASSIVGVWTTASRRRVTVNRRRQDPEESGQFVQVSRLGWPLVNEVVIPLHDKDNYSRSEPRDDVSDFGEYILNPEVSALLNLLYGVGAPETNRTDIVGLLGPNGTTPADMIRLNLAVPPSADPNPLSVLAGDPGGFPNGRRLIDDVVAIELTVLASDLRDPDPNNWTIVSLDDGVAANDVPFMDEFPYLADPHAGNTRIHANPL